MSQTATLPVRFFAPAKINLALHVTGRRTDGYHLLDMLVVFARFGDEIAIEAAETDHFAVSGRFATGIPTDGSNLVLKARDALRNHSNRSLPAVSISLAKQLPIASGIGGGSSDAAATMLALNQFWQLGLTLPQLCEIGLALGADVPMCLHGAAIGSPLVARGIGEELSLPQNLPALPIVLINDGTALATPDVFRALKKRDNAALTIPAGGDIARLCAQLQATRNDLFAAAQDLAPHLAQRMALLQSHQPLFAQMSGSGATCFALFADQDKARQAAAAIRSRHPDWFVVASETGGSTA